MRDVESLCCTPKTNVTLRMLQLYNKCVNYTQKKLKLDKFFSYISSVRSRLSTNGYFCHRPSQYGVCLGLIIILRIMGTDPFLQQILLLTFKVSVTVLDPENTEVDTQGNIRIKHIF